MAISRHKVLSEMQQQLELASSKCGNLQKQLEIVKDKVRQSSTTNLLPKEPPEEKENKMDNGEVLGNQGETERNREYQHVMSLSSSSTEDVNEERDVNIIKVFYDRLGQMDYPPGHVELSDISSEENDLDIDQLLSSVNFSMSNNEKTENEKRKEKRSDKKAKEKSEKMQRRKKSKGRILKAPLTSPYESHLTNMSRQSPLKIKNQRNKTNVRPSIDSSGLGIATQKPISRGQISKPGAEKPKKRRQANGGTGALTKNTGKQVFQEPINRVINLASELRKTKSSTGAHKSDIFTDSRSLTRLHSDTTPGARRPEYNSQESIELPDKSASNEAQAVGKIKTQTIDKVKHVVAPSKGPVRFIRNNAIPKRTQEVKLKRDAPPQVNKIMKDKGTSLSDVKLSVGKKRQGPENNVTPKIVPDIAKTVTNTDKIVEAIVPALKSNAAGKATGKNVGGKVSSTGVADKKTKLGTVKNDMIARPKISEPKLIETDNNIEKTKNGIIPHLMPVTEDKAKKSDVRRKVHLFEATVPKDNGPIEVLKKGGVNERSNKSRGTALTITRTNSRGTLYEDSSRIGQDELRRFPSLNNLPPVLPVIRGEPKERENADISPLTINQVRRMKDNLMKFNTIPFIVGQSTNKSYHIGLNIQQTYSLFKQTPSMTALKVSRFVDNDQHSTQSRGRSTKTGYTGRSLSTVRGRETCPACGPAPDPSPEQLADPWAVPQDDDGMVIRVCTCLPKRIISFDQVLNQLYFTDMNLVKLHPSLLPSKDGASEETEDVEGREKAATLTHRGTNTLYYTKLLRSIQNLKDNILG